MLGWSDEIVGRRMTYTNLESGMLGAVEGGVVSCSSDG